MERGLKQKDVAEELGVDQMTVWNWERNRTVPASSVWPKIVAFLGYNPLPEPESLGEQIAQSRKLRGLSQRAFAKQLGVDQGTLVRWERGKRRPAGHYLRALAIALPVGTADGDGGSVSESKAGYGPSARAAE